MSLIARFIQNNMVKYMVAVILNYTDLLYNY